MFAVLLAVLLGGSVLVVSPQGPYTSLADALAAARNGDTIEVHGGRYVGNFVIDRSISLVGIGSPVLEGQGKGTVVRVAAPDVAVQDLVIRGSGENLEREDTGIVAVAPRARIEGNRLEDVLFGITLQQAPETVVRGNTIHGKDLPLARKGDAIRVWESPRSVVEGNTIQQARDLLFWYSEGTTIRGNHVRGGRYGLHLMFNHNTTIEGNVLEDNSVGVYLMYSRDVTIFGNTLARSRGPSGYAVGLKDTERVTVEGNVVRDNRVGLYMDTSPDSIAVFRRNAFAFNDIGAALLPGVQRATFSENAFLENQEQVAVRGGGDLKGNAWSQAGRGNYWSDYVGYDANGDGIGDAPYRSAGLFENITDRNPSLRLFGYSPAAQAVDLAARAFPLVRPQVKLEDAAPLMQPVLPPVLAGAPSPPVLPLLGASAVLVGLALGLVCISHVPFRSRPARRCGARAYARTPAISVRGLTKRFGRFTALADVTFAVAPGEAIALWGPNGAGKTTLLKCLLGLVSHRGSAEIEGWDAAWQGKKARGLLGYVPQEPAFYPDLTVGQTMELIRRLRKTDAARVGQVLRTVGLEEQAGKPVRTLSGGMEQRLALAVALLSDPPVLLLDEPTANLDAASRDAFLELLQALKTAGKALVLTSHRFEEVEALCDRVLVLKEGRLVLAGTPDEVAQSLGLQTEVRLRVAASAVEKALAVLKAGGFVATRNSHALRVQVDARRKLQPLRALERAGVAVEDMDVEGPSWT